MNAAGILREIASLNAYLNEFLVVGKELDDVVKRLEKLEDQLAELNEADDLGRLGHYTMRDYDG